MMIKQCYSKFFPSWPPTETFHIFFPSLPHETLMPQTHSLSVYIVPYLGTNDCKGSFFAPPPQEPIVVPFREISRPLRMHTKRGIQAKYFRNVINPTEGQKI